MSKRVVVVVIYLIPTLNFSQDFSEFWNEYFSYLNITEVINANNKVYAAAENAVFSYDPSTNQLATITTINGLSGELISTIHYSDNYQLLLIGYQNGLIEVFKETDNEVLKVIDIVNKTTITQSNKKINHFNELDSVVYIATDYGISVYNLENLEFGDTFFIGIGGAQVNVSQTTIFNNYIYASCLGGNGIKKADITSSNLIDFQNWQLIFPGNWSAIASEDGVLYATDTNRKLYQIINDVTNEVFFYSEAPEDLRFENGKLIVTTQNNVFVYDSNFNLISKITVNSDLNTKHTSATLLSETIYIGTSDHGVLKTSLLNPMTFEELHPDGPLSNNTFSLELTNNDLWLVFGGYGIFFDWGGGQRYSGISRYRQNEWFSIPYDSISSKVADPYFLSHIAMDPFNPERIFISSYYSGLLEIENQEVIKIYDENNSTISPFIPDRYLTSASEFDDTGALWLVNGRVKTPLNKFENNKWTSYDFTSIIPDPLTDELGFSEIVIGSDGTKWIGSYRSGLIGFNETGMLLKNIYDKDIANLPSPTVKALALDKNNVLWIGTYRGLIFT